MLFGQSLFGLIFLLGVAWTVRDRTVPLSRRRALRIAGTGLAIQFGFALVLLQAPGVAQLFLALNQGILALQAASEAGTSFVFGYLGGAPLPFEPDKGADTFVLAFRALPLLVLISALAQLFYHWGVLQRLVRVFAWILRRTMRVDGAVGLAASANIFLGMIESPLLIRAYLGALSRSEMFATMTVGMATVAGTVMALYANLLSETLPDALGHILVASMISVPAALTVSRLMVSPTEREEAKRRGKIRPPEAETHSAIEAIVRGTLEGAQLLINIIAMLAVTVALVYLINGALGLLPDLGQGDLTLQRLLGWVFAPVAWAMGIPWHEAGTAGALLGTKTVLNELIAYLELSQLDGDALSPRSRLITLYALCGFANPASLAMMIGGLSTIVPDRRDEIVALAPRCLLAGTLATCLTGAMVGVLG